MLILRQENNYGLGFYPNVTAKSDLAVSKSYNAGFWKLVVSKKQWLSRLTYHLNLLA